MHSCEIVSSKVNQPRSVISKFLSVISVFTGPVRYIVWMLQIFNRVVRYAVLTNPFGNIDGKLAFLET